MTLPPLSEHELPPPEFSWPRRPWFPVLWLGLLAAFCTSLWFSEVDPGVTNTVINIAVALGVVGVATWVVTRSGWSRRRRWTLALVPTGLVAAYFLQLLPFENINNGDGGLVGFRWRWADPDRKLDVPPSVVSAAIAWRETPHDYPRFLGNGYWAEVDGVELESDWEAHAPQQLWKQPIGAGWAAFAIVGDYAVTQEQRGDRELVVCYELSTGKPVWTHGDAVRWDPRGSGSLGGIGPRATPTVHDGKAFTVGATGILNCLDATTGKALWSHDTLAETGAENVMWGKACSPIIVDDTVVVSAGAKDESLIAYDIATGKKAWSGGSRRSSYATPVLTELAGVRQIVSVNENFVTGQSVEDGTVLWEHPWIGSSDTNASCSQPVPVGEDRILLTKGYGGGAELIKIVRDDQGQLAVEPVWKNNAVLRTKMSNVVVRDGYVYGLNDGIFQCVELETGRSKWKKRRTPKFGHGQILLVGDAIVMISELGELILFEASPKAYRELAHLPVLEGVTWNNPALSGSRLLVRNGEQAACFELPLRGGSIVASHN